MSGETQPFDAEWAAKTGADSLIITGSSFSDKLGRIGAVRAHGIRQPVLIGGGVTEGNVGQGLERAVGRARVALHLVRV